MSNNRKYLKGHKHNRNVDSVTTSPLAAGLLLTAILALPLTASGQLAPLSLPSCAVLERATDLVRAELQQQKAAWDDLKWQMAVAGEQPSATDCLR